MSHLQRNAQSLWQPFEQLVSLRWRLTAMLGFILLCTLLVISIIVATFVRNTEAVTLYERQRAATIYVAQEVSNLAERIRTVLNLVRAFPIDELEKESEILQTVLRNNPILIEIAYFNTQGDVVAQASLDNLFILTDANMTVGVNAARSAIVGSGMPDRVTERAWFLATQQGQSYFDVAQFTLHQATGYAQQYLLFAMPATNQGTIAARIHTNELHKIVMHVPLGEHGIAYLVNPDGQIIAHPDRTVMEQRLMIGERPEYLAAIAAHPHWQGAYTNVQQTDVIGMTTLVPDLQWVVVTEVPRWEAYATSRRAYIFLGGGMLAFVILMMWASAEWLEGLILIPVERLRDSAERIGQGDLAHRIEVVHQDEIGQVALAFNQMAGELQGLYGSLEQKIVERTQQLEAQKQELARSNAELAQFAYVASHDLQEPLRMVAQYLQLIEARHQGQFTDETREFLSFAVTGATRMQSLIRDLLVYSRVGTYNQPFQQVQIDQIVQQVLADLQLTIKDAEATIHVGQMPQVIGDATQLGQLFQNLLTNALKFRTQAPPQVEINAVYEVDRNIWIFAVHDNGIGIAPDHHERIFRIFQRLHTSSEYPGTGIGLAICKKIVERHGGQIWVESEPRRGTTFFFTLPA